ncbi:bifunctional glutamate N-acetyltransferase/amino-acid acetyltransferase ArgJ [Sphingomonas lacunae]|uniref:Arginine biosynthesis bifunctional protein ArgJ n=1 Tax=Sphingomonas lacunae TaxID=2698828 RepID=A0A6M4B0Z5_9SPHN|nr:bifunctional glutamate N-acetyltransferase/amino-acid acetyltransferase ArgJ [Sphingomonas lacunae]QJQ33021.1 bifunctional glutamate N-acetyltransferase/amino-acid acetyltransferase ArgJ [Sphingomonas lacunae]
MNGTSPLAPTHFPDLPAIAGVTLRVARARYKNWDRCDLTYVELAEGTAVAGVTTRNLCCSTEVEMCREGIARGSARALIVNAGNSNAFTGYRGREAVELIMTAVSGHLGCAKEDVFVCSTGVIGVPLPKDKARDGLAAAFEASPCTWEEAANTILTTDTFAKGAMAQAVIGDRTVNIVGIAKGSGMIAPDMATMLAYVFTDAAVEPAILQAMLSSANRDTFNSITVDSDTSTSDTLLVFATAKAGNPIIRRMDDCGADALAAAIRSVCRDLAHQIVRDGEGASKFVAISVTGAKSDSSAKRIGLAIANSPLVKTAIAGEDANWGRVVMAVGKAGEPADRDRLAISFGDTVVARDGLPVDGYDETPVAAHLKGQDIRIHVDIGLGEGQATVWTCDLTHGYISINADYRS